MVTTLPKQFCKLYNYPEDGDLRQIVYDTEDHNAWLEARKGTIGGSEVSVILGTNPYQSELHLWNSKQLNYKAPEPSVAMKKGTMMESVIFDNFVIPWCSERGWNVENPLRCLSDVRHRGCLQTLTVLPSKKTSRSTSSKSSTSPNT